MESNGTDSEFVGMIRAARHGSESALNRLCSWLRPQLEELCRGRFAGPLRTKVTESDLIQESLLGLSQTFNRFQGHTQSDLLAWTRGILEHKSLELQRRFLGAEKRNIQYEQRLNLNHSSQPGCNLAESWTPPLERLITVEEAARVKNLTAQLPDHYQQVIEFRFLRELSFPDIAVRMNRTEASVKNIFVRAMEALSQGLRRE